MACPHSSTCALYPKFRSEALLNVWKLTYCETAHHVACARFQKSTRGEVVPINLLPNGTTLNLPTPKPGPGEVKP